MLRALDPNNDYQPKSVKMVPTEAELKKFSAGELEDIAKQTEDDAKLRLERAVKAKMENAIRDQILGEAEGGKKGR